LETNLEATRDRFEIGDVTRTDVAQSEARLALARSRLTLAEGRATAGEQNYRRVIGQQPGQLQPPPPLPPFPATADEAVRIALSNNPDLIAITRQAEAAGYDVKSVRGTRLPTIRVASGDMPHDGWRHQRHRSSDGDRTRAGPDRSSRPAVCPHPPAQARQTLERRSRRASVVYRCLSPAIRQLVHQIERSGRKPTELALEASG
jgi:hypothetical protein